MDKFWSPWRSKYIESFKDEIEDDNCVFCAVSEKDVTDEKSLLVHKGDECFVVLNLYPYNSGHMLVVPYRHSSELTDLCEKELTEMMRFIKISIRALEKVMKPQGFNFGANLGKAAGAGIDAHIHFHIIPRWTGDTNFMPVIGEVKVISQDLLETKKNVSRAFAEELAEMK